MIVVAGELEIEEADIPKALEAARAVAPEVRREPGCRAYAFYRDVEAPGRFHVFEEWDDDAALKAHFETEHMKRFRAALGEVRVTRRDIRRYAVDAVTGL